MTTPDLTDHVFNDDLLANAHDVDWVCRRSPGLIPAVDYPRLRQVFLEHDRRAIRARGLVMTWGVMAIAFTVVALLAAATESLWGGYSWAARVVGTGTELMGLLGALVGAGGMWFGPSKRNWLLHRLAAERIRQWQFQFLTHRGDLIRQVLAGNAASVERFNTQRDSCFDDFLATHHGKLDSLLTALLDVNYSHEEVQLRPALGSNHGFEDDRAAFDQVADFYRHARLRHQLQYTQYKLQTSTPLGWWRFLNWPPRMQEKVLGGIGSACLVLAICVSVGIIIGHVAPIFVGENRVSELLEHPVMNAAAVGLAIIAVAIRTIEDGLGVHHDIDRFRHFATEMQRLIREFDEEEAIDRRLKVMEECEQACFEESREFLMLHYHTKFTL